MPRRKAQDAIKMERRRENLAMDADNEMGDADASGSEATSKQIIKLNRAVAPCLNKEQAMQSAASMAGKPDPDATETALAAQQHSEDPAAPAMAAAVMKTYDYAQSLLETQHSSLYEHARALDQHDSFFRRVADDHDNLQAQIHMHADKLRMVEEDSARLREESNTRLCMVKEDNARLRALVGDLQAQVGMLQNQNK